MSFLTWLSKQSERMDRIGDLAKDFLVDTEIQEGDEVYDFKTFFYHLDGVGGCDNAIDTLCIAYVEFLDYQHELDTFGAERLQEMIKEQNESKTSGDKH